MMRNPTSTRQRVEMNLGTMGNNSNDSLLHEDDQLSNSYGNKMSSNNVCNDDLVEGDEIFSPNHFLCILTSNNEE